MDHLLCDHIHVMEGLKEPQDEIKANSVCIGPHQLPISTNFVAIDTEWNAPRWGYGPDGHITEFGAAHAEAAVLVTGLACSRSRVLG